MAIDISVKVLGLREVTKTLTKKLPPKARGKVVARAMRIAARAMVRTAKSAASRGKSGSLTASTSIWQDKKRSKGDRGTFVRLHLGPRRSNKAAILKYWTFYTGRTARPEDIASGIRHGHLVEFGVPSKGIPARPFLRPAFDRHGREFIKSFGKIMALEINKEATKQARKQSRRR